MAAPIPSNLAATCPDRHAGSIPLGLALGGELLHCGARGTAISTVAASHLIGGDPVLVAVAYNTIGKETNMTAFVRLGGIAAFAAVLAFSIALGFRFAELPRKALDIIFPLVMTASFVTVFLGTKRFFNAHNYRRADIALLAIVGFFLVNQVMGTAAELGWGYSPDSTPGQISDFVLVTVALALSIFFAFRAMGFAPSGGRIWGAIGILYATVSILAMFAVVASHFALEKVSAVLQVATKIDVVVCFLILVAALIVHGIALTSGASKMRAPMAAA